MSISASFMIESIQLWLALDSNQLKRTDNLDPTASDDIRYSLADVPIMGDNTNLEDGEYYDQTGMGDVSNRTSSVDEGIGRRDRARNNNVVRNFDGLLLKTWDDLGEGQEAIANAIRNVVGDSEEANMIVDAVGGDLATAERVYNDFLKGSVIAEQWKPRLGEIKPIIEVMKQVGASDEDASSNIRYSLSDDELDRQ